MTLVVRIIIVAVDYSDRVIELKSEFEAETASGVELEHPAILYFAADTRGYLHRFAGLNGEVYRSKYVVAGRT